MTQPKRPNPFASIDRPDMYGKISNFPAQIEKGLNLAKDVPTPRNINRVVVSGMGGSVLPADIVDLHLGPLPVPFEISRDYLIRLPLDPKSLVFAASFSGDTEETLCSMKQALESGANVVAVTTGGKLADEARKANCPLVLIPESTATLQPRLATGYFFAIYAGVLEKAGLLDLAGSGIDGLPEFLQAQMAAMRKRGRALATKLIGKIVVYYASERYARSVARINKIKINENSKSPAFWNAIPELTHNEMQGFASESHAFHFVFLQDPTDRPEMRNRFVILGSLLRKRGYPISTFRMPGADDLQRAFAGLLYGDWVSYYLAVFRNIDPTPVDLIDEFKAAMKRLAGN